MEARDTASAGTASRCAGCRRALAHDQRYCTACGTRRGPLPTRIWAALAQLSGRRSAAPPAVSDDDVAPSGRRGPGRRELVLAGCAAAASVLLMLGAGSVMGAATAPGGVQQLADTIVVALSPTHHVAPQPSAQAPAPGGGGGGSPTGSASGAAGGGGAAQTTRPVTISQSSTSPGSTTSGSTTTTPTPASLPPIDHVWEIVLSGQGFQQSFGTPTDDPYLARTLARQGTVISDFYAVATSPLANEIALVSGQGPTAQTLGDCPQYSDIVPGRIGAHEQALGDGCVYPSAVPTLGSELEIAGDTWRAFIQGVGEPGQRAPSPTTTTSSATTTPTTTPTSASTTTSTSTPAPTTTSTSTSGSAPTTSVTDTTHADGCPHPAIGAADPGQVSGEDDYVTWTNPWVYFDSVLGGTTCPSDDVGLGALRASLRHKATTPTLSYIAADLCDDGSATPCRPGARSGLRPADAFLKSIVPEIERSAAYRAGGLILVTFDEAPQSGPNWSTASCCGQPTYPNLPSTTQSGTTSTTSSTNTKSPTTATSAPGTTSTSTTSTTATTSSCSQTATTPTSTTATTATSTTSTTTSTTTAAPCAPAITGDPPGGGQVGLLMISPYVTPDQLDALHVDNDFSLLRTLAQLLHVTAPGYADAPDLQGLSPSLFTSSAR